MYRHIDMSSIGFNLHAENSAVIYINAVYHPTWQQQPICLQKWCSMNWSHTDSCTWHSFRGLIIRTQLCQKNPILRFYKRFFWYMVLPNRLINPRPMYSNLFANHCVFTGLQTSYKSGLARQVKLQKGFSSLNRILKLAFLEGVFYRLYCSPIYTYEIRSG